MARPYRRGQPDGKGKAAALWRRRIMPTPAGRDRSPWRPPSPTPRLRDPGPRRYTPPMPLNPPDLRPDRAPRPRFEPEARPGQPRVGMVSLGCPKALVDSERILTRLRAEGYAISPDYPGADAVIVNTCGFLDSAKAESLEAIGEALAENGRVIVTGCLGADEAFIRGTHPTVLAVTGPQQYEAGARRRPRRRAAGARPLRRPAAGLGGPPDAAPLQLPQDLRGL